MYMINLTSLHNYCTYHYYYFYLYALVLYSQNLKIRKSKNVFVINYCTIKPF